MVKRMKLYDEAFLSVFYDSHAWFLYCFLLNYKMHNTNRLIFAYFGLYGLILKIVKENVHAVMNMTNVEERGWFKKPLSMLKAPSKKTVWIDLDCEVRDNLDDIFNLLEPNKLAMVEDKPWTWRRGHLWHNSGVVGFIDKPLILRLWVKAIKENPVEGDQEVLDKILSPITKITYIKDLPNKYNVLRLQMTKDGYAGDIKVAHWTGMKGKLHIRDQI